MLDQGSLKNDFSIDCSSTSGNHSNSTRVEGIKLVVMEKFDLQKREESLTIAFLGLLRFWCRDKKEISIEPFFESVNFSIDTLMEELKPVVTERYEFEYQEESLSKALIGSFGLLIFCCQDQIKRSLNWIHPYKCNVFVSDLYGKNQTCRKREKWARK